jgi:hypothetical protein
LRAQSRFLRVAPLTICRLARCQAVRCRVGPCRDNLRIRCRIRGLIRRYVRLKRLVCSWCLVKQICCAHRCQHRETELNEGATGKHLPQRVLRALFYALEPPKESGIGGYMPSSIVTAYCEKCSVNHPTAVELNWPEQIPPNKSIAEVFDGIFLPPEIAMMSRNYFLCPQTGKISKQTDSTKTFLAKTKKGP